VARHERSQVAAARRQPDAFRVALPSGTLRRRQALTRVPEAMAILLDALLIGL
jgi:hypothetical protein